MAVVLCDGAPASLKALTWASVPGHLMRQHEGEQLILTHVWVKGLSAPSAVPKEIIDGIPAMLDDPAAVGRLPPSVVVHRTLEAITESKVTRDSLNYKIETMALIEQPSTPALSATPTARGRSSSHREKEKESPGATSPVDVAAAEEEVAQTRAAAVVQYAHDRAVHHRVPALILGVGNREEGKTIAVGHVAAAALRTQREAHPLWFMKSSGSTLRTSTPAVRYVVVLVPPSRANDNSGDNGNDNGGDNEDNSGDKDSDSSGEKDSDHSGEKDNNDNGACLERDTRAVAYAMSQCRAGTGDVVAVVVVADPTVEGAVVEQYTEGMAALLQREPEETAAEQGELTEQAEQREQTEQAEQREQTEQAEQREQTEQTEQRDQTEQTEQREQTEQTEQRDQTEQADTGEEGAGGLWPVVSVCTLRATKHLPSPTAATGAAQVVKFLQQRKVDVVVVSAVAPEPLQLALLGMSKPHVLVLPSSIQCQKRKGVNMAESGAAEPRQGHRSMSAASHDESGGVRQQFLMETPALVVIARRRAPEAKGPASEAQAASAPAAHGHSHRNSSSNPTASAEHIDPVGTSESHGGAMSRVRSVIVQRAAIRLSPESADRAARQSPDAVRRLQQRHIPHLSLAHPRVQHNRPPNTGHSLSIISVASPTRVRLGATRRRRMWLSPAQDRSSSRNQPPHLSQQQQQQQQQQQVSGALSMRLTDLQRPSAVALAVRSKADLARRSVIPRKVMCLSLCKYPLLRVVASELGFTTQELDEDLERNAFNLVWSDTVLPLTRLVRLANWQRTNHFPSMHLLCRKGHLGITLGRMRKLLPTHFNYYPRTWSLRSERLQFTRFLTAVRARKLTRFFIMKPNSGCQGRGIVITRDPMNAVEDLDNYIAQEYITRPLLLEERKFDLRVYVLLTSIREPSIFLFNDGLVRMCAEKYDKPTDHNSSDTCKHLTNYAVNKHNPEYVFNADMENGHVGHKRNFRFLNSWLTESSATSPEVFWEQVSYIICKTILVAQPQITSVYNSCFPRQNDGYNCFEVLGFDILIDSKMKPWLIEVNHTPSFSTDTPLDYEVKHALVTEVLDILDIRPMDRRRDEELERERYLQRTTRQGHARHAPGSRGNHASINAINHSHYINDNHDNMRAAMEHVMMSPSLSTSSLLPSPAQSTAAATAVLPDSLETAVNISERRAREDTKLRNFRRIYPTQNEEHQLVYGAILAQARALCTAPCPSWSTSLASSTPHIPDDRLRRLDNAPHSPNTLPVGSVVPVQRVQSSTTASECAPAAEPPAEPPAVPSALRERAEQLQRMREELARKGHCGNGVQPRARVSPVISVVTCRRPTPSPEGIARLAVPPAESPTGPPSLQVGGVARHMDALRSLQEMLDLDAACERSPSQDGDNNNNDEDSFVLGE